MKSISAVFITYNEERIIAKSLEAVKDIADEIIVVDSDSSDRTQEICESYGAKVFRRKFTNFADQKNFACEKATKDFILSLDADEVLSDGLRDELLIEKENDFPFLAYKLKRLTNYCGKWVHHCGWYPDMKLRIWKNGIGTWEGDIHEFVKLEKEEKVKVLKADLLHYSYFSIEQHLSQMNKYTTMMAEKAFKSQKRAPMTKVVFSPMVSFVKKYFFKQGFRDGYTGFIVCALSSVYVFLKYIKLRKLYTDNK